MPPSPPRLVPPSRHTAHTNVHYHNLCHTGSHQCVSKYIIRLSVSSYQPVSHTRFLFCLSSLPSSALFLHRSQSGININKLLKQKKKQAAKQKRLQAKEEKRAKKEKTKEVRRPEACRTHIDTLHAHILTCKPALLYDCLSTLIHHPVRAVHVTVKRI